MRTSVAAVVLSIVLAACSTAPEPPRGGSGSAPEKAGIGKTAPISPAGAGVPTVGLAARLAAERVMRDAAVAANCEAHLRELASRPHPAGSAANRRAADYVTRQLESWGYRVEQEEYHVLLPRPRRIAVEMLAPMAFSATIREAPIELDFDTHSDEIGLPYCAFSPSADVEAPVVFANYGRREDFEELVRLGVRIDGSLIVARFGKVFRGSKAAIAQEYGAAGLLLYSDPADDGFTRGDVYPKGPWRPMTAVQRGSILQMFRYPGDPGTPGRPSLPGAEQLAYSEMTSLPSLPTTCLSAADVEPILRHLEGPAVPAGWQGGLPFTYHTGGARKVRVRLLLEMEEDRLTPIFNTVATWAGGEYPEETVIVGNHRDAWVHGAVDPGTGTAVMLEAARLIAESSRAGHPPARTVKFVTWDAEEFGMIGSTEWGEHHAKELDASCVAYVNVDVAVSGPALRVAGSPSLSSLTREVLASVPGRVGATRLHEVTAADGTMRFGPVACGSDYTVFVSHLGIPCIDVGSSGPYGVYHSGYDTFSFVKRHADPGFETHRAMSGLVATLVSRLAGARILPMDYARTGAALAAYVTDLEREQPSLDLAELREIAAEIVAHGTAINEARAALVDTSTTVARRIEVNRRLYRAERLLLLERGLPGRPWYRHALYAPDPDLGYGAGPLTILRDALKTGERNRVLEGAAAVTAALKRFRDELAALAAAMR